MAGGSVAKEKETDEQCPKCERWYFGRGNALNMHKANCDGEADTDPTPEPTPEATDADVREAVESVEENPAMASPSSEADTGGPTGYTCDGCSGDLLEPGDTFTVEGTEYRVDSGECVCVPCGLCYDEGEV